MFKRYANPFLLLDNVILTRGLSDYITTLNNNIIDDLQWQYYLHRVFDKSYDEWKDTVTMDNSQDNTVSLEATVNNSINILRNFSPQAEE